ncbi:hypothetical protein Nepgr_000133 [Nepenthes gracilis]|uniref:Uncharacterized protein n=1 Tax=Nepenthes gracilis TaxID=150966 RepID=A0AAD3RW15_NEPGR|nr:hypothetical protein Nepgr_000133 [Nepenthes gracilis]
MGNQGFDTTIAHPEFNSPNPSSHSEFSYLSTNDGYTGGGGNVDVGQVVALIARSNTNCRDPFQRSTKALMREEEEQERGRVACRVYDQFSYFAQIVADDLNLPGFSLRTSAGITSLAFAVRRS